MPVDFTPNNFPTVQEFRDFVAARSRLITLDDISKGCGVSVSWIKQVLNGEIKKPSYENVTAVYKFVAEIENGK